MIRFTQGKWFYEKNYGVICNKDNNNGFTIICNAGNSQSFPPNEEEQANARLIAAAPKLYEILHNLLLPQSEFGYSDLLDEAQELINHIDGKEVEDN